MDATRTAPSAIGSAPSAIGSAPSAIGIDGCPGGWIAAIAERDQIRWELQPVGQFARLLPGGPSSSGRPDSNGHPDATDDCVIAVDIPVGLVDRGWRACDLAAKAALGRAHARVFLTPPRAVLTLGPAAPNAQAQALSRALTGAGVSRQALALAPRILEVDRCLPDERLIEVHPELSFAAMAGHVLASKHGQAGIDERINALTAADAFPGDVGQLLGRRPRGVPLVDALDALAALWTAHRHRQGCTRSLPKDAPVDASVDAAIQATASDVVDPRGTRMKIVV